jgi:methylmalonyl-CoA/ethylmalonyl-CoA epimerase
VSARVRALDHVGIVVEDYAGLDAVLRGVLGLEVGAPEMEESTAMEVLWVRAGAVQLQFIRPTRDDTGAAAVLRRRGPGVHHVGLEVDDVASALTQLRRAGIDTRDAVPRPGARGALVGFVDPGELGGAEVELVQRA